jgi:hypothetical protein
VQVNSITNEEVLKMFCGQCLFPEMNIQAMHIKSLHNRIDTFSLKPYTLAGFKPGSYVLEADAMSTAPRQQECMKKFF